MTLLTLTPEQLAPVESPEKLKQLQKTAIHTFKDIHRKAKNSDGTMNAVHMELILADMWARLVQECARVAESNPTQKPALEHMLTRMKVLVNQLEELFVHGRDIEIPEDGEQGGHAENVVFLDPSDFAKTVGVHVDDHRPDPGTPTPTGAPDPAQQGEGLRLHGVAEIPEAGPPGEDQRVQPPPV